MTDPLALLASLRDSVRLDPAEDDQARAGIFARCGLAAPARSEDALRLYAYEKALIFDAVAAFMHGHPAAVSTVPAGHPADGKPGRLFTRLQPFVLR